MPQINYSKQCEITDRLLERNNSTTPDFLDLKLLENIPVFVYGDEMVGFKANKVMNDAIFLGSAVTSTMNYVMEHSEFDTPIAFRMANTNLSSSRLYGEVFLVDPKTILNLDQLNGNNEMTTRERTFVTLLEQSIKDGVKLRPSLKCWFYLGKTDFWESTSSFKMTKKSVGDKEAYKWENRSNSFEDEIPNFLKEKRL